MARVAGGWQPSNMPAALTTMSSRSPAAMRSSSTSAARYSPTGAGRSAEPLGGVARCRRARQASSHAACYSLPRTTDRTLVRKAAWFAEAIRQIDTFMQSAADVARGITEFLRVAGLARAHGKDSSAHCAPQLHVAAIPSRPAPGSACRCPQPIGGTAFRPRGCTSWWRLSCGDRASSDGGASVDGTLGLDERAAPRGRARGAPLCRTYGIERHPR
jgi:hypothetical protein